MYPRPLLPVLAVWDRTRMTVRLSIIMVVLLVPCMSAVYGFVHFSQGQISFSERESDGNDVLLPALELFGGALAGRRPDLGALNAAMRDNPELFEDGGLDEAHAALTSAAAGETTAGAGRIAFGEALAAFITGVANESNLILDPDLDSFYVMDMEVVQLPRVLLAAARAASPVAPAGAELTGGQAGTALVAEQAVYASELTTVAGNLRTGAETSLANTSDDALAGRLAGVERVAAAAEAIAAALTAGLGTAVAVDPAPLGDAVTAVTGDLYAALGGLIDTRVGGFETEQDTILAITVTGVLLAVYAGVGLWWHTRFHVGHMVAGVQAIAAGDLAPRPLPTGRDEFGDIGRALGTAREKITAQEVDLRAGQDAREQQMAASMSQQQRSEALLRERAKEAIADTASTIAMELTEVADQVERVRTATNRIDGQMASAAEITESVVTKAAEADRVTGALNASLRRVAEMAQVIAGVADQTRMLALNATIEAARAGEMGKGFAVVAGEVKDLATASARSTDQISSTISSLEADVAEMFAAIGGVTDGIGSVNTATLELRQIAADQHDLVQSLDRGVAETLARINNMVDLTDKLERREHPRYPDSGPVTLVVNGERHTGRLVDVSLGGLHCTVPALDRLGPGADVTAELGVSGTTVALAATVVHRAGDDVRLRFLDVSPQVRQKLARHIDTLGNAVP
ncbi:methyl-accepting chemotaxis protein [Catenuloplanes nepalensis]|uniref:Methyl-accepting chemotaxis protein n=1 Tax=Catenuloplanes nepalensis TaxID=587533 RepID=A0ABT9N153_9ACTN|nr:methyl-accepting chemotaxis protein [Catenuloplanes nepalensis]MDP9797425.1 methyl-accepting chemotaxis protein [Catenuloplanes nepalensis]